MAKFCINCGEAVSEDAKFCPSCGAKIGTVIKKEDSLPGLGTLLLRRAHEYDYKNYSAPVYVDGDQIGEIYDSGELRIKLEDGDHQINVSVREKTIGSKTVHISGNKTTSAIVSVSGGIEVQETVSDAGSAPQQTDYARLYGTPSQRTVKKKTKKKWTGLKTLVIVLGVFMVLSIISHLNDGDVDMLVGKILECHRSRQLKERWGCR
mgnify:CR=1 FL=1